MMLARILRRELVAVLAMRACPYASRPILRVGYSFKMARVHAIARTTEMVDLHTIGDWAACNLVDDAMSQAPVCLCIAVRITVCAAPGPAFIGRTDEEIVEH